MDALAVTNITTHTYDSNLVKKLIDEIVNIYFPELKQMHDKLEKQLLDNRLELKYMNGKSADEYKNALEV